MSISFNVRLGLAEWAPHLNGWDCPVLRIPGIEVTSIEAGGAQIDPHWYEVRADNAYIKWQRGDPIPPQVTAFLALKEVLVTKQASDELTRSWKQLAILTPVLTAAIAASASYVIATRTDKPIQNPMPATIQPGSVTTQAQTSSAVGQPTASGSKLGPVSTSPHKAETPVKPSELHFPFDSEISSLTKTLKSNEPYSWPQYDTNLQQLESILSGFVSDLQSPNKISQASADAFFQNLEYVVGLSRERACHDLPNDGYAEIHCSKNFNDYDNILSFTKKALTDSNKEHLPDNLLKVQTELAKWLNQSIVKI